MTASDARGPGLLYVNSQIDSAKISPEVFTKWYEDEHISDILRTSGMNSAYRYYTTSTEEAKEEEPNSRPYLALYPLEDISFLETEEFKSIPVHSDLVPTEGRCIFDVADFDVRYYTSLGREESQSAEIGPGAFVVLVHFNAPPSMKSSDNAGVRKWYLSNASSSALRVRLYNAYFGTVKDIPQYLALHEFDNESNAQCFVAPKTLSSAVASFRLLRAFGDVSQNF